MRGFHRSSSFTIKCLKSTVSEEEEEGQTPHTGGTQTSIQRQTDRQADPHPRTLQPLTPHLPALLTTLEHMGAGGRQGTLQPHQIHIPGSGHPLREGGVKEGLCIFLYLWQTAVLAWFNCPMERSTSLPAWSPWDTSGHLPREQKPALQMGYSLPPALGSPGPLKKAFPLDLTVASLGVVSTELPPRAVPSF